MKQTTRILTLLISVMILSGCSTKSAEVNYHLLNPGGPEMMKGAELSSTVKMVCLVVGPVNIPTYLNRPQVVIRNGSHTLSFDENNRWAEPLEQGITRAVAGNLMALGITLQVARFPVESHRECVGAQLVLDVRRFDVDASGVATLDMGWNLSSNAMEIPMYGEESLTRHVGASGPMERTKALDGLLFEFCRTLAGKL